MFYSMGYTFIPTRLPQVVCMYKYVSTGYAKNRTLFRSLKLPYVEMENVSLLNSSVLYLE